MMTIGYFIESLEQAHAGKFRLLMNGKEVPEEYYNRLIFKRSEYVNEDQMNVWIAYRDKQIFEELKKQGF